MPPIFNHSLFLSVSCILSGLCIAPTGIVGSEWESKMWTKERKSYRWMENAFDGSYMPDSLNRKKIYLMAFVYICVIFTPFENKFLRRVVRHLVKDKFPIFAWLFRIYAATHINTLYFYVYTICWLRENIHRYQLSVVELILNSFNLCHDLLL